MVAADITTDVQEYCHIPGAEVVVLTATDDETYTSKKFATVLAASATIMEDDPRSIACSVSGATVTIRSPSLSDKKVCLVLFGKK